MAYGRIRDFVAARFPLTADAHVERIDTANADDKLPIGRCAGAASRFLRHCGGAFFAAADVVDGAALWIEVVRSGALADLERAEVEDLLDDGATYAAGGEREVPCRVRSCGAGPHDPCTDRGLVRAAPHADRVERWLGKVQADELSSVVGTREWCPMCDQALSPRGERCASCSAQLAEHLGGAA